MIHTQQDQERENHFPTERFADLIEGNRQHAADFHNEGLTGQAKRGLAIVTCMDSRVDPLGLFGLHAGDAKVIRNAGARVTEDVLRTLVLATYLLNVSRVLVMAHTNCKMASATEDQIHETISAEYGVDTRSLEFRVVEDPTAALKSDLIRIRSFPLLPKGLAVGGAVYDVRTGLLAPLDA
jgi:carbonic anhydrase